MNTCTIIVPTHTKYLDICKINSILIKRFWNHDYEIVYSIFGDKVALDEVNYILNDSDNLVGCIKNAAELFPSKCYMVLLGDAFILKKVDSALFNDAVNSFLSLDLDYCNLIPYKSIYKKKTVNEYFNYINKRDWYSHSFIAFLASYDFINNELADSGVNSDRDFELKYLNETINNSGNNYYERHVCVRKNLLNIFPGIEKGQWNRIVKHRINLLYPGLITNQRDDVNVLWQIVLTIRKMLLPVIPNTFRRKLKHIVSLFSFSNFSTNL